VKLERLEEPKHRESRPGTVWRPQIIADILPNVPSDPVYERLRYLVIDDLDGDVVIVVGYRWPLVTKAGTLLFHATGHGRPPGRRDHPSRGTAYRRRPGKAGTKERDESEVGESIWVEFDRKDTSVSERDWLHRVVSDQRRQESERWKKSRPSEAQQALDRPLRLGDTFAVVLPGSSQLVRSAGRWSEKIDLEQAKLYDITLEAREAAKAALFAALVPPVDKDTLKASLGKADSKAARYERTPKSMRPPREENPSLGVEPEETPTTTLEGEREATQKAFPTV
jgi:hypothetical protein